MAGPLDPPEPVKRVLWFVALWGMGVLTVGVVAYGIRAMIG